MENHGWQSNGMLLRVILLLVRRFQAPVLCVCEALPSSLSGVAPAVFFEGDQSTRLEVALFSVDVFFAKVPIGFLEQLCWTYHSSRHRGMEDRCHFQIVPACVW